MCFKLKEHQRATFFSSPENRCLPASTLNGDLRFVCRLRSEVLKSRSGCKNSGKIWWMMKFMSGYILEKVSHASSSHENGYSYEWINGQKPHLIKNGIRIQCNTENFVPIVVLGLTASSSSNLPSSTSKAGN